MAVFDNIKGIGVASGFKLQAQSALDPRLVVATIAERDELVTGNGAYEGMSVYVKANKKTYQLQGTTTSDWVDITSEASSTSAIEKEISDAKGSKASLKDRIDDVEATANSKVASVSVGDGITKTGTNTDPVLDVKVDAIEGNLIDFEYDGHYWHEGNEDKDRRRDYFLRSKGYKIVRIKGNKRDNKLPTKEQIKEAVYYLVKDNHSFIVIDMMNI